MPDRVVPLRTSLVVLDSVYCGLKWSSIGKGLYYKGITQNVEGICDGLEAGWRVKMVRPEGVEPPTYWFVASCSIQLSYGRTLRCCN